VVGNEEEEDDDDEDKGEAFKTLVKAVVNVEVFNVEVGCSEEVNKGVR
jgi:hypothetical protein